MRKITVNVDLIFDEFEPDENFTDAFAAAGLTISFPELEMLLVTGDNKLTATDFLSCKVNSIKTDD